MRKQHFIQALRATKLREHSQDLDNALQIIATDLYSEDVHFVLELVQNKEFSRNWSSSSKTDV